MKRTGVAIFYFLLISIGGWMKPAYAEVTEVQAVVDKNPAMADESITLQVTANGDVERNAFDPSPLLKDFVVGRTSVSSQTRMVNFSTSRTTTWSTTLIPRTEGTFTIPAFTIEGKSTQPINVEIIPVSTAQNGTARNVFITASTDTPQVYLQQQLKYTVKLHLAVDLQRGSLAAPTLENADIRQIGKDAEYTDIINGTRYRIIERTFAITPQQSGTFRINGPLFEGEVLDNSRQSFGFFNRTKMLNRVGPAVDIEVLPIPSNVNGHWLPSEFVQLNEEWQPAAGEYKVGDPITRTLTLTAVGLVEEQLPSIGSVYPDEVKTYPDQATTATVERNNTLIAQRVENIAIIPSSSGTVEIPEVRVPWFNVVTKQTEYATLPARKLNIAAATEASSTQIPIQQTEPEQSQIEPVVQPEQDGIQQFVSPWWSNSSLVFLVLWILTLLAWLTQWLKSKKTEKGRPTNDSSNAEWAQLTSTLKTHEAKRIYPPLTKWLAWYCENPSYALPTSQRKINDAELDRCIKDMFASQYGDQQSTWKSDDLAAQLTRLRNVNRSGDKKGTPLKTLYPQQTN